MAKKTKAYVDTSAFIAFFDKSDSYHSLFLSLFSTPPPLITTALVISEAQGWFLRRYDIRRALEFMAFIESLNFLEIYPIDSTFIKHSLRFLRRFSDQALTLTDAGGLYLMEKQKISSCWSTDRHLGLTKVNLVIY